MKPLIRFALPLAAITFSAHFSHAAVFTIAGFTFDTTNTVTNGSLATNISYASPGTTWNPDPTHTAGNLIDGGGTAQNIDLTNGSANNSGNDGRTTLTLSFSNLPDINRVHNQAGDDFVVYEAGSAGTPEAFAVSVRSYPSGEWSPFRYEFEEDFETSAGVNSGQFATGYDLSDFGLAPDAEIDAVRITNIHNSSAVTAPNLEDRVSSSSGDGFVSFDAGPSSGFEIHQGPEGGLNADAPFPDDQLDADITYVVALHDLVATGVPLVANSFVDDDFTSTTPGFGTDHFTDLQSAVDVTEASGTVTVAPGHYLLPGTVTISRPVTIVGPEAAVDPRPSRCGTRTTGSPSEAYFDGGNTIGSLIVIQASDVTLDGLEFGNGTGDVIQSPIAGGPWENIALRNLIVHNSGDEAIQLRNVENSVIEDNHVFATTGDCINVCCGSTDNTIQNNEAHNSASSNGAIYVYNDSATTDVDITIQNNLVYDVTANDGIALGDKNGNDAAILGGRILNNIVHDVIRDGIHVAVSDISISGNEIHATSGTAAINVATSGTGIQITCNNIHDNTLQGPNGGGVVLNSQANAAGVAISTNNFVRNQPYGIYNGTSDTLSAPENYYGSPSGPDDDLGIINGGGDRISLNVNPLPFSPVPVAPNAFAVPPALVFTPLLSNQTEDLSLIIGNDGLCTLIIECPGLIFSGPGAAKFSLVSPPAFPVSVATGSSVTLTVRYDPAGDCGAVTATASLVSNSLPLDIPLSASTVGPCTADVGVTLSDSPDPADLFGTVTYTATVTNGGVDHATSVTLDDTLTSGGQIQTATPGQGTCIVSSSDATCDLGTLDSGSSTTVAFTVLVTADGPTTLTDTATVAANEADPDSLNNTATEDTTIRGIAVVACDETFTSGSFAESDWLPIGSQTPGFAITDYDSSAGAFLAHVFPDPVSLRVTGVFNNSAGCLSYASVGTDHYIRGKFYVYTGGEATNNQNEIPNMRLRVASRFSVNSMLEVNNHLNQDPAATSSSEDLRPSSDPANPSLYRVDYDPVDVPLLSSDSTAAQITRGFDAYSVDPQDNGYVALTELSLSVYPAASIPDSVPPTQTYETGTTDAGTLRAYTPGTDVLAETYVSSGAPDPDPNTTRPLYSESAGGVTLDTTQVPSDRVGIVAREFNPDPAQPEASHLRVEEGKQYKVRFHLTSTQFANRNAHIRMRARTVRFNWTQKYEVGGAFPAGALTNQIAQEALPGIGSQNPDKDESEDGGWYTLLAHTPLSNDIRPEFPGPTPNIVRMPNLATQPAPGVELPSLRDLRLAVDLIDTQDNDVVRSPLEEGNFTVDKIEVRVYPLVQD